MIEAYSTVHIASYRPMTPSTHPTTPHHHPIIRLSLDRPVAPKTRSHSYVHPGHSPVSLYHSIFFSVNTPCRFPSSASTHQVFPKRCGHLDGKALVPIDVFVEKVERAAEASRHCSDGEFIICARTDAAGVPGEGFDRAVERAGAYVQAGADMIFPEGLQSEEDFGKFAEAMKKLSGSAPGGGPFMLANMTEFGKTPYLTLDRFHELGYHCVIYPVSTLRAAMKGVEECLQTLKDQGTLEPFLDRMQTRPSALVPCRVARKTSH
ncbi:unnamed protein product [Durusdinium trenchii]|uniref:Methylisocitrate lyase n=1 Tax=Durusdinium trenchii TaxID=1381693 RepID=A0ABP0S7U8_9DINO